MEFFLENCYYCVRKKDISQNKISKEDKLSRELSNYLYCGGCFNNVKDVTYFVKIAKIKNKNYGFCSEECYEEWLSNPVAQSLSPINETLFKFYYVRHNQKCG